MEWYGHSARDASGRRDAHVCSLQSHPPHTTAGKLGSGSWAAGTSACKYLPHKHRYLLPLLVSPNAGASHCNLVASLRLITLDAGRIFHGGLFLLDKMD